MLNTNKYSKRRCKYFCFVPLTWKRTERRGHSLRQGLMKSTVYLKKKVLTSNEDYAHYVNQICVCTFLLKFLTKLDLRFYQHSLPFNAFLMKIHF